MSVDPAGAVSDERLRHLRDWYRQEFADLSDSQMITAQTASICDELLDARQQLAELQRERDDLLAVINGEFTSADASGPIRPTGVSHEQRYEAGGEVILIELCF
jgi:hypothetical protein